MNIRVSVFGLLLGIAMLTMSSRGLYGEDQVHIVQRGETFFSIARARGVSAEDLMRHNGVTDPTQLRSGQQLRIPGAPGGNVSASYRVARGDTLFSIARNFLVSVDALRRANNLSDDYVLREGDMLRLPSGARIPQDIRVSTGTGVSTGSGISAETAPQAGGGNQIAVSAQTVETAAAIDPSLRWPVSAREVSRMTGNLSGVVVTGTRAEPVRSLTRGTVLSAGPYRGFGMVVIIQVDGGYLYVYGGSETLSVSEGDFVVPGTELGRLGIDPSENRPLLFFMVYRGNNPIDPAEAPRS